jgi:2-polyprenyl-3-methyl-5-hydroxy-6-metoxy-1,4-benzoquinol methylase
MSKQGEIEYIKNKGEKATIHALNKPFSDPKCGIYLMDMGTIFMLLPEPKIRNSTPKGKKRTTCILDLGVGTGWTSIMLAKRGFKVVGIDISSDMIELANDNKKKEGLENIEFHVCDFEDLNYLEEFDAAIFYDCLHHAEDEELALTAVYNALIPGGLVLTYEPGTGHSKSEISINAMNEYGVTEKDMPPFHIINLAKKIGFSKFKIYKRSSKPTVALGEKRIYQILKLLRETKKIFARIIFRKPEPHLYNSNIVCLIK